MTNNIQKNLKNLSDIQRLSLYRMLYWKNHKEPIPRYEVDELIADGFFVKSGDGLMWSDKAQEIDNLFK
jgi:hypothetical protein